MAVNVLHGVGSHSFYCSRTFKQVGCLLISNVLILIIQLDVCDHQLTGSFYVH